MNLNELEIRTDCGEGVQQTDYSASSQGVSVYFKDLEERLIAHIEKAAIVFGCVAWLTSEPILAALAGRSSSIIVQKEDFLRPDTEGESVGFRRRLQQAYGRLHCEISKYAFPKSLLVRQLNYFSEEVAPIQCVGNHNSARDSAFPRSHHKFLVFANFIESVGDEEDLEGLVKPYGVWTGSYNFTKNAGKSFENAIYLTDPVIVHAFSQEFSQVFAFAEPLDWDSQWVSSHYRIGT